MIKRFYDTNGLLLLKEKAFEEPFFISSVTLEELEHIKQDRYKDEGTKYDARKVVNLLEKYNNYTIYYYTNEVDKVIQDTPIVQVNNDVIICACAYIAYQSNPDIIFVTDDGICGMYAKHFFNLKVETVKECEQDKYKGFIEKDLNEAEMASFYQNINQNTFNLLTNQYLVIKANGEIVDTLKWDGNTHKNLKYSNIKSEYFGPVKPYQKDIYQAMALDSLMSNQVTMLRGFAGTGKSWLSVGTMFALLEKHKIDKIIVFCNTVATANSAKLGFYPGTREEKLIDSSIGNMLSAKVGGMYALDQLIDQEKILLLPMSDIRGFDTTNMKAAVYITEAQNLDISLMKLALQRIGEDSICIIDGDNFTQTDLPIYSGSNNGMRRMSQVFRGQSFYGEVELQNIHRSKIAQVAEMM